MKISLECAKEILAEHGKISEINFREPFWDIRYALKDFSECGVPQALRYKGNAFPAEPDKELDMYLGEKYLGTYAVGNIALGGIKKLKEKEDEINEEALRRLAVFVGNAELLNLYNKNSDVAAILFSPDTWVEPLFPKDLYIELREYANKLFIYDAREKREFLESSLPRRD